MPGRKKFMSAIKLATFRISQAKNFTESFDQFSSIDAFDELTELKSNVLKCYDTVEKQLLELDVTDQDIQLISDLDKDFRPIINKINSLIKAHTHSHTSNTNDSSSTLQMINNQANMFKLPDISLPQFEGKSTEWPRFRDLFKALVIDNSNLSNINKFIYLNTSLKGDAKLVVENLEVSGDNFAVAWNLLLKRFDDPRAIVKEHLLKILDPPKLVPNSANSLQKFIDFYVSHINALLALNNDVKLQDLLLVALICKGLSKELLKDWELHLSSDKSPNYEELISFLTKQQRALASMGECDSSIHSIAPISTKFKGPSCYICLGSHHFFKCDKFAQWTPQQRSDLIRSKGHCVRCLKFKSPSHFCNIFCNICRREHNELLHFGKSSELLKSNHDFSTKIVNSSFAHSFKTTLLPTAVVDCISSKHKSFFANSILDSGSEISLMTEYTAKKLRLLRNKTQILISNATNDEIVATETVTCTIRSCYNNWKKSVTFVVVPTLSRVVDHTFPINDWGIPNDLQLADPNFNQSKHIHILLGVDIMFEVLMEAKYSPQHNVFPFLKQTQLGWIVAGPLPGNNYSYASRICCYTQTLFNLPSQLQRFWELEHCCSFDKDFNESEFCVQHFNEHVTRDKTGRYIVRLPVLPNAPSLGSSRSQAERRLFSLERRLKLNPKLSEDYHNFMSEYHQLGHMIKTHSNIKDEKVFIPHHPVFKPESTSTKTRIVYDASARTSNGVSLNDILATGPVVQDDIFTILLRFRIHPIAMIADIEKMYRQVKIHDSDQHLQHILWRNNPTDPIDEWALTTVTYGTASASFLATQTLIQLANDEGSKYPLGKSSLINDFYVDDFIKSCEDENQALQIAHQLSKLLQLGGFKLRKWSTNSSQLLDTIPTDLRETNNVVEFNDSSSQYVKTLGLLWYPEYDYFKIVLSSTITASQNDQHLSKRKLLSYICSIYDPLGLIAPVVILCKLIFQDLWNFSLKWDDPVPEHIRLKWQNIFSSLKLISNITIPRMAFLSYNDNCQLHGFCDSSQNAYGACIYARTTDKSNVVHCRLICAKSRVAPRSQIKSSTGEKPILTIPRLELCAALLLSNLIDKVLRSISFIRANRIFLWSDSDVILSWLKNPPIKGNIFVRNRVTKILSLTYDCVWRHVPSKLNSADFISRGMLPMALSTQESWWHGPQFLTLDNNFWPKGSSITVTKANVLISTISCNSVEKYLSSSNFSPPKIFRIIAYMFRFVALCRIKCSCANKCLCRNHLRLPFTVNEVYESSLFYFRMIQSIHFNSELTALKNNRDLPLNSKLSSLSPFLHSDGLLRVLGRLQEAHISFNSKHPIILPQNHGFTKSLIMWTHRRLLHAGPSVIIADIRQNYWIISIRRVVRTVIRKCLTCFKQNPTILQQIMGNLPATRVQPSFPFNNVGIDYTGFFNLRLGGPRSKTIIKAYIAFFICMSTKAVHTEIVSSLTTSAFIAAFNRFISRRGLPSKVFSDNASTFKCASHEINTLFNIMNSSQFQEDIMDNFRPLNIDWVWMPPRSPHCSGLWEANIKSLKYHLKRVIGLDSYSYEEFSTITAQIEAILNSRPLVKLNDDPLDLNFLTPGHFLIGRSLVSLPNPSFIEVRSNRLSKWQEQQKRVSRLWKCWSKEYLHTLQQRQKWRTASNNIKINTPVLLVEENLPTGKWLLGIVTDLHCGKDGKVRVVTVNTKSGSRKRHIQKICPLPIEDDISSLQLPAK